ncbi:MAG TPA: DUF5131 family protein [Thermoanaerobaculaceae bacterium]|nr:DUF5131 family protein [Thermoanaerobaculaceae bacterium]
MGESSIGWLHPPAHGRRVPFEHGGQPGYSVNYWIGCSKVDQECKHCYAEREAERRRLPTFRDRSLPVWGQHAPRHFTTAATLRKVRAWDREAAEAGWPRLIFGGSQMDWLEDRADLVERRAMMLDAIEAAPNLRWILLTKRPENFARLASRWRAGVPSHVWIGISAGSQPSLDAKLGAFEAIPAQVKLISGEPLIGPTDFSAGLKIAHWLILGGESGPKARPCNTAWIRWGIRQARAAGRHVFVKQLGAVPVGTPSCIGCEGAAVARATATCGRCGDVAELVELPGGEFGRVLHLAHGKGEDPREWPADLRVQEWPDGSAYDFGEAA